MRKEIRRVSDNLVDVLDGWDHLDYVDLEDVFARAKRIVTSKKERTSGRLFDELNEMFKDEDPKDLDAAIMLAKHLISVTGKVPSKYKVWTSIKHERFHELSATPEQIACLHHLAFHGIPQEDGR